MITKKQIIYFILLLILPIFLVFGQYYYPQYDEQTLTPNTNQPTQESKNLNTKEKPLFKKRKLEKSNVVKSSEVKNLEEKIGKIEKLENFDVKLFNKKEKNCLHEAVTALTKVRNKEIANLNNKYKGTIKTSQDKMAVIKEMNKERSKINELFGQKLEEIKKYCEIETGSLKNKEKTIKTKNKNEITIKITANGFEPKEVEITKGTKVTWINEQPNPSWPASDVHPTHEVYPGSSIKKCGTPEQNKIFDACRGLKQGESWSFVFNEVGEWYYHDHLNPSWKGEIVVK
jgi:plastocyanin